MTAEDLDLGSPLREFLAEHVPRQAASAHKRCRQVDRDDFEQAMWAKVLSSPLRFKRPFQDENYALVVRRLKDECNRLIKADERYRRAQAAAQAGYDVWDIEFYSTGVLAKILPALAVVNFDVAEAMQKAAASTDAAGVHIGSGDPFGGKENYLAILTDVAMAYGKLSEGDQRTLRSYYGANQDDSEDGRWDRQRLASSMGLTEEALRQRASRALRRLQAKLGGEDPWR